MCVQASPSRLCTSVYVQSPTHFEFYVASDVSPTELRRQLSLDMNSGSESRGTVTSTLGVDKRVQMQTIVKRITSLVPVLLGPLLDLAGLSTVDKLLTLCLEMMIMIQAQFIEQVDTSVKSRLWQSIRRRLAQIHSLVLSSGLPTPTHTLGLRTWQPTPYLLWLFAALPDVLSDTKAGNEPQVHAVAAAGSVGSPSGRLSHGVQSLLHIVPPTDNSIVPQQFGPAGSFAAAGSPTGHVMRTKKADRVEQWLLSCVHQWLADLMREETATETVCGRLSQMLDGAISVLLPENRYFFFNCLFFLLFFLHLCVFLLTGIVFAISVRIRPPL
jgi:hypothetical protein